MLLTLAAVVFAGGVVAALRATDVRAADLRWWPLVVVAVVGTPATIVANAAELRAMGRCLDPAFVPSWARSVRLVVVATAANVLPLPGGALVRVHALTSAGASVARSTAINLLAAGAWVATAVALAGAAAIGYRPALGVAGVAAGLGGIAVVAVTIRAVAAAWSPAAVAGLLGVEVATTLLHAARLWLVLVALDVEVVVSQAVVLGAAAPLAAAAGMFPAGLGLAELLSALLAPAVALPAATGLLATALARVLGLAATAPIALALGVREQVTSAGRGASPDASPGEG